MNEINYTVQAWEEGKWIDMVNTRSKLGAQEQAEHWSSEGLVIRILGSSVGGGSRRWIVGGWSVEKVKEERPLFWWMTPTPTPTPTPEFPPMEEGVSVWIGR